MPRLAGFKLTEEHKRKIGKANYKGGRKANNCIDCGVAIKNSSTRCHPCRMVNNPAHYKTGLPKCIYCGIRLKDYNSKQCRSCWKKNNRLENHPNWQGGKSFEPYPLGWNKTYKEQIRYRDGYKCQICEIPEAECVEKLHVHHIDYNKNNLTLTNLVVLCRSCHTKTNFNRIYWKDYFNGVAKT